MPLQQTSGNSTTDAYGGGVAVKAKYIENFFVTWLRTGTGASATVTTGLDASANKALVWTKSRSPGGDHKLTDTVRGVTKALISDTTGAQTTDSTGLTAFSSTGYTIGADTNYNNSGATYVDWEFVATPKFFDVVTYTGDGSGSQAIAHSLASQPGFILIKRTDNISDWASLARSDASNYTLLSMNLTNGTDQSPIPQTSAASSTNINVGYISTIVGVNTSGDTYVAYVFAHNAGGFGLTGTDNVISCGSFTTDASGNATVSLGYEPQWLMFKSSSGLGNWQMVDNMRGWTVSGSGTARLFPNSPANEVTSSVVSGVNSTGFNNFNLSVSTDYIYIAIRRGPMKVPTDATKVFAPVVYPNPPYPGPFVITTGFPVSLSIIADRTATNFGSKYVADRLCGTGLASTKLLNTASASAEYTTGTGVGFLFDSNIQISDQALGGGTGNIYWNFQRAPGFFDEVCDTGTGSAHTISHNLQAVPELIIRKGRSGATQWEVYSSALANTEKLVLNSTAAKATDTTAWNSTTPTSSVFTVGTGANVNTSSSTYVAYLFATCPGVSKVGSYTGNGTTQTINCGFTAGARFVLIKRTDSTGDWYTYDTARGMTTLTDPYLLLNSTAAEAATLGSVTTVTTGFAVNASILAAINTNAATYIFLAIA